MKGRWPIGFILLVLWVACSPLVKDPEPAVAEHGRSVEGPSPELSAIDSLMWQQPDSALAVLLNYLADDSRDVARYVSTDETFDNHYAQLLASELLFKNNYAQTNRKELLQAVAYFDSLLLAADGVDARGETDTRGVSLRLDPRRDAPRASAKTTAFLAARAHYINGAGYYERDSLIEACTEYLRALRTMESHFTASQLVGTKARFMALIYTRLLDMFSKQYMQEPAIYCGKQSLAYNRIAHSWPGTMANILYHLGKQYGKLNEADSATYYYEKALEIMPDRNTMLYRDVIVSMALLNSYYNTANSLDSLKRMAMLSENESERLNRFLTIGGVYQSLGQYDSAKVYLGPVLESNDKAINKKLAAKILREIAIAEGDTLKASQYSQVLAEDAAAAPENLFRVSQLNELFQNYLQEKQEMALALERQKAQRRNLWIGGGVIMLAIVVLVVAILTRRRSKKRLAAQEAEAQRRLDEASQRLSEAAQRHDEAERELQTKVKQAAQHTKEMLQQRVTDIYQSNGKDRLQRILEAVDDTYPQAVERLKSEHPELGETEWNILLLNFLHFRIKEEADLLGLSESSIGKYRSNLGKALGKDPISDWI